jgi:hypothetical protein
VTSEDPLAPASGRGDALDSCQVAGPDKRPFHAFHAFLVQVAPAQRIKWSFSPPSPSATSQRSTPQHIQSGNNNNNHPTRDAWTEYVTYGRTGPLHL